MANTRWSDQPAILENAESIAVIGLRDAQQAQIMRVQDAAWIEFYVTIGNLFGSQTVRVRDLESAIKLIGEVSYLDENETLTKKRLKELKAHGVMNHVGE